MTESESIKDHKDESKYDENVQETQSLNSTDESEKTDKVLVKRSLYEQIMFIKSCATVEPILALSVIPRVIASLATTNLNLDKACRVNLNYGNEVCDALKIRNISQFITQEQEVQKLIASIQIWKNIIQSAIPLMLITFMGAWSDRTGKRKICMIMPVAGEIMVCISNLLNTYYFYEIPVEVTMFLEGFLPALCGGNLALLMGIFSYISDVTSTESRTFRVGIVNLCMTAGWPIGTALSGIMVKHLGFYSVFSICGLLFFINILYTIFVLEEIEKSLKPEEKKRCFLKNFFDLTNLKETFTVVFKKREKNKREKIFMMLAIVAIIYGVNNGESSVMYMYTRYRFGWDAVGYSMYNTFHVLTHTSGALFSITVFSRRLKFDDSTLGLISVCSQFFGCIMKIIASTTHQMYIVAIVEILNATTFTSLRSIASKLVPSEEMGKINSMLSLVETFAAMVYEAEYSWLYKLTLPVFPAAVFVCSAVMVVPAAILFLLLFIKQRTERRGKSVDE